MKAIVLIIAMIAIIFAQITGIGEALYLWGGLDNPFGPSVWEGFKTWMIMMGGGIITAIAAIFLPD